MKTIESDYDFMDSEYSDFEGIAGYQVTYSSVKPQQMSTHKLKGFVTRRKTEELKAKPKRHKGFEEDWH